jgi:ribosomal small subunit protein bTHX
MGRGDRRTKRGKIFSGSFGKVRPKKKQTIAFVAKKQPNNLLNYQVGIISCTTAVVQDFFYATS